jgi:hypothetical protein
VAPKSAISALSALKAPGAKRPRNATCIGGSSAVRSSPCAVSAKGASPCSV